jgi:PAS domain S-box-containing protein
MKIKENTNPTLDFGTLPKKEKLYLSIFENIPNGFAYCKMEFDGNKKPIDFTFISVNENFESITNLRNVAGKKVTKVIPDILNSDPEIFEICSRVILTGKSEKLEIYLKSFNIWLSLFVFRSDKVFFSIICDNITERKRTEEALRESEERFRKVFEEGPIGMVLTSGDLKFFNANPAFCQMLGYTLEEMTNVTFLDVTHPDYRETDKKNIEKMWRGDLPLYQTEKRYITKNGDICWGSLSASIIKDVKGKPIYALAMVEDITERKKAELIIQQKNKQLQELNDTKDKFFSIIAHDLKSPFLGFLGLTQDIIKSASNISVQELSQLGKTMNETADNLFKLLQNLLEWAQLQSGSGKIVLKDILLTDMIAENVEMTKSRSEQKGISIINMVTNPINAYADEKMINSVLMNLLSNAIKFTHQNGAVTISAKKTENQMIEISIRDTGVGMPKNMIEKLFKVGENIGRKGTEGELSTGLGLLLCKEFVDRNGGKIWVESEEGKGSTFIFTLQETGKAAD